MASDGLSNPEIGTRLFISRFAHVLTGAGSAR
jgi:DNA-binding CsgD family transcriptional regulator